MKKIGKLKLLNLPKSMIPMSVQALNVWTENCSDRKCVTTSFAIPAYDAETLLATVITPEDGTYTVIFVDYEGGRLENVDIVNYEFSKGVNIVGQEILEFELGKVNIVDLFVIIIIIAAIAFTYFKFNMSEHSDVTSSNVKAEYTFMINSLRSFSVDAFSVGDKIYDDENGKCIGTIKDIKTKDAYDYITKTDGTVAYSKLPERYTVELCVEVEAVLNDKGLIVNGAKTLHNNQKIVVYTQKVQTEGQIIDVNIEQ